MKKDEINLLDMAFSIEVKQETIDFLKKGLVSEIEVPIDADNKNKLLENIDGNLILCNEELPDKFYDCYFYNSGQFPYVFKEEQQFILFKSETEKLFAFITKKQPVVGTRFTMVPGKSSYEDPNGEYCLWKVHFYFKPLIDGVKVIPDGKGGLKLDEPTYEPKTYLMRWNPAISSFSEEEYARYFEASETGSFRLNWSIFEWEEARPGDKFYMMLVGQKNPGIAFFGEITSNPYVEDDWAGSTKRRHYVDLLCLETAAPGEPSPLPLERLQDAIPEYEWAKGHSGVLLPTEVADKLDELWQKCFK
jgi:hypothetical protein